MNVTPTALPEVLALRPREFRDERGLFMEVHRDERYAAAGITGPFVQDNVSRSAPGVVRGLHLQSPHAQGKLVTLLHGAVWDVAVDVRPDSPTFGRWVGVALADGGARQLWIPPGFAHGFAVTSDVDAIVTYKCTAAYDAAAEHVLRWDDPELAIAWPVREPRVSDKDRAGLGLAELRERLLAIEAHGAPTARA